MEEVISLKRAAFVPSAISHFGQTSIWMGIGKEIGYKGMIKDWAMRDMKELDEKQVLKLLTELNGTFTK